jgi:hypothetical protein
MSTENEERYEEKEVSGYGSFYFFPMVMIRFSAPGGIGARAVGCEMLFG